MEALKTLIMDPLVIMYGKVTGFVPTLVSALVLLFIGVFVSKLVHDVFHRVFKEIKIDKIADALGLSDALHKGGVKSSVSGLLCSLVYLIVIFMFFLMTVEIIGLTSMNELVNRIMGYIPAVISASLVLVLGMLVAGVVGKIVHVTAHATKMPKPKLYEKISRYAIIIYAATVSLGELGYGHLLVGKSFHILFAGVVFAYALAFGLGGRDAAARYLDKGKK